MWHAWVDGGLSMRVTNEVWNKIANSLRQKVLEVQAGRCGGPTDGQLIPSGRTGGLYQHWLCRCNSSG